MKFPACADFLCVVLAAFALTAQGADLGTNATSLQQPVSGDMLYVMFRLIGALFLVIAVFLFGVWFFKRSRFFSLYQGAPAQLKILESKAVGYRNTLIVVGYFDHRFLLAVSASGVNLVSPLPDAPTGESPTTDRPSFADHLGAVEERKK